MANYVREVGTPTRVSTSAFGTLGAGKNISLVGIGVAGVLTAQLVNLWIGSNQTSVQLMGTMSLAANSFMAIPAICSGGLSYRVTNDDIDLTIYWNPEPSV